MLLHHETLGPDAAPPLLLLHGAAETFRTTWRKQLDSLARPFHLIGPDLRGHGASANPADRLDLRAMADDVAALLDHLGIARAHLCGFSGGASVALFFALHHPGRLCRLVLVSNNMERDEARAARDFWNPTRIRREQPAWWAQMVGLHRDVPALLRWWAEEDRLRPNFDTATLAPLAAPTLLINGDRDPIIPLAQTLKLHAALPHARLAIVPTTRHGIHRTHPELFDRMVTEFLLEGQAPRSEEG